MTSPYLTVKEVATLLRVGEKTVYRHIREIPGGFKLFNGTWLFDRSILLAEIAKPKEKAGAPSTDDRHQLLG